jgi:hypothetical protein
MLDGVDALFFVQAAVGHGGIRHLAERHQLGLLAVVEWATDLN